MKSIEQHKQDGTTSYKHKKRVTTKALERLPKPPLDLNVNAIPYWYEFGQNSIALKSLTQVDLQTLQVLCERYLEYKYALKYNIDNKYDNSSMIRLCHESYKEFISLARDFGFTPRSRTAILKSPQEKKEDQLDKILKM